MTNVIEQGGQMPTRGMNDPSPMSSEPQAAAPSAEAGEMSMRGMNAPAQAPMPIAGDSPREREKLAVYRREHPEVADSQSEVRSMPGADMGK